MLFSGCAAATHVEELLTLKEVSDGQKNMQIYVDAQDKNFEKMLGVINTISFDQYTDQAKIISEFGEPVIKKEGERKDKVVDIWVYRYATQFFSSPKIYLYFDESGKLLDSELVQPSNEEE